MGIRNNYILLTPIYLCFTLLVFACESQVSQCQRLMKMVDQGNNLIDKNKGYQVTTSSQLAKDLKKITQSLTRSKFQDPKLIEFNSKFATIFKTWNQQIGKASKALGTTKAAKASQEGRMAIKKAREEIDTSLTDAQSTAKQFDTLFKQFNDYCSSLEK
ncbi:MAG: hypothetical protein HRU34_10980 [Richelia sp.]|nr:hypothetical protein [Richelia sp.]